MRQSDLQRFVAKCMFEPRTGCVLWVGATTAGRGNTATYGSFWFERRSWYAHRWAAKYIHGHEIDDLQVGHYCPHTPDRHPNTLCVEHVRPETQRDNLLEQRVRGSGVCAMTPEQRRFWLLVDLGYEQAPPTHDPETLGGEIPYFRQPSWLVSVSTSTTRASVGAALPNAVKLTAV